MILFIMTVPLIFNNSLFVLYFETTKMLILGVCFISHSFNGQVFFKKIAYALPVFFNRVPLSFLVYAKMPFKCL